jgi:16S rRNA (adenine1518-N6/adenine1519-N6)-dimethyltransferase
MSSVADAPTQPTLRRMREFGVRPDRDLGQNFLIDSNILGVIGRAADLSADDVVLEVGGGLGVLSEYLAGHVRHVHVVEVDTRLREALSDAVSASNNVTVHWGDAMQIDLTALDPPPSKVVSNLPYGIAAGLLLRTIEELPLVLRWVAMVQREVGERLAAAPGSGTYGTPSVLAQLACEVKVARSIPRSVFYPVPNVDSVLVTMVRRGAVDGSSADVARPAVRALVGGAFAHRRKTAAGSLSIAGGAPGRSRDQIRSALGELGHPGDVRAERLAPQDFIALAERLGL